MILADEKTVPRLHLMGTLVIVFVLTLVLGGYFSWRSFTEQQASFEHLALAATEAQKTRQESELRNAIDQIEVERQQTEEILRRRLIAQVDTAIQIAEAIHAREALRRPVAEVKRLIVEALRPVRFFDGRGYYFINDMKGRLIMQPAVPEREGQVNFDTPDASGTYATRLLTAAAREPRGQGFARYSWPLPDVSGEPREAAEKLAYVRYFAPFDWLIGTGDYLHEWEALQKQDALDHLRTMRFGSTGYLGVIDSQGILLLSPSTAANEGVPNAELTAQQRVVVGQIQAVGKHGGGFTSYEWPDQESGKLVRRTGLVEIVQPWGWTIVASMADDELQAPLREEVKRHEANDEPRIFNIVIALLVALAVGLLASLAFSVWSGKLFKRYRDQVEYHAAALRLTRFSIDVASDQVYWVKPDGSIVDVNRAACESLGYSRKELLESKGTDVCAAYSAETWPQYFADLRVSGSMKFESVLRRKDDSRFPVEVVANYILLNGEEYNCAFIRDISERRASEEALLAAKAEAERANNAKSRFRAAASHDLRQPLAALTMYMGTLRIRKFGVDQRLLGSMSDCISSLSTLLSDLLDISKLEAKVLKPEIRDFSLAAMLSGLSAIHLPLANEKRLALRFRSGDLHGLTDPVLFARILGNLIANAIKYTAQGGVLVGCRRHRGKTWVEVWDSGIGIAPDKTQEIFEEYRQLDPDQAIASGRPVGSGLGLAIVAKMAELLNLEVRLESRLGKGSMFAIELPLGRDTAVIEPLAAKRSVFHIALVEDNASVLAALSCALTSDGHRVTGAVSGRELLHLLAGEVPDLIISDYRLLDGETGIDVIGAVRQTFGETLPALIVTGDTDPEVLLELTGKSVSVLHKPLALDALLSSIERLMQGRAA